MKPYYTLLIRMNGKWSPQFGDYVKAVVAQERKDTYSEFKGVDWQIVKTADDLQASIDAVVTELNKGT